MKLLLPFILISFFTQAQDSTFCVPISIARQIEKDLRVKDELDSLYQIQDIQIGMQSRLITRKDSIHSLDSLRINAYKNISFRTEDEKNLVKLEVLAEKKRARRNGWERNIAIGAIAFLMYVIAKP